MQWAPVEWWRLGERLKEKWKGGKRRLLEVGVRARSSKIVVAGGVWDGNARAPTMMERGNEYWERRKCGR